MDPRDSPYSPGAGTKPVCLSGRDVELERFSVLVDRLARRRPAEAVIFAGSRAMGKTVILRECERRAREKGWFTAFEEIDPQLALRDVVALVARDILSEMSASKRYGARIKRALGVLKAFTSIGAFGITLGIDSEMLPGTADSGLFKRDLLALCRELGEVAASDNSGVAFFLDELHTIRGTEEMAVLDAVIHGLAQEGLPVTVVGAGIFSDPQFRAQGDVLSPSTYGGRLYRVLRLRPLSPEAAASALRRPAAMSGVTFSDNAIEAAVRFAGGIPWFLQIIGEEAWTAASSRAIGRDDVDAAIAATRARLYEEFYPRLLRVERPEQEALLRRLASSGGKDVDGYRAIHDVSEETGLDGYALHVALREFQGRGVVELTGISRRQGRLFSFTFPGTTEYVIEAM